MLIVFSNYSCVCVHCITFFSVLLLFLLWKIQISKSTVGISESGKQIEEKIVTHWVIVCIFISFAISFALHIFFALFFGGGLKELFWTQKILVLLKTEKIPAIAKCFFSRILSSTMFQILLCVHYFITDSLPVLVVHERDLFEISKRKNSLKRAKKMWIFFFTVLYFSNGMARIYAAWSICIIICKMHRELCTIHQ